MLARREHSEFELSRKLRTKGYANTDIQAVILDLIERNLLSNYRFTESYIFHRRTKGYGPIHIRAELTMRGIPEDLIDHQLNIADNAWLVAIRQVWQKRFKGNLPRDFKTRAQQMRFLQSRGFTQDHINSLFQDADYD